MSDPANDPTTIEPISELHAYHLQESQSAQESSLASIRLGDWDDLRCWLRSHPFYINQRICCDGESPRALEPALHDLWYAYYQGARHISHDSAQQQRIALVLFATRGLGPLTTQDESGVAITADGILWDELPFFAKDMVNYWIKDCAAMDATHRLNLASFVAKLAATGVCDDRLCQIALLIFRDTLETERPIGSLEKAVSDGESEDRAMGDLSIASLLPALESWLDESGDKILQLSDKSWNGCSSNISNQGPLLAKSEFGQKASSAAFTPARWLFWLKRLDEIEKEAAEAGETRVAALATECIECMLSRVDDRKTKVLEEFDAAGDDLIRKKHRFRF